MPARSATAVIVSRPVPCSSSSARAAASSAARVRRLRALRGSSICSTFVLLAELHSACSLLNTHTVKFWTLQGLLGRRPVLVRKYARLKGSRATLQAASATAVAVAAVAAGIAAGSGSAAASTAGQAQYLTQDAKFKHPQLAHGLLAVVGTRASDKITLRLKAGNPGILQVDVGDDGSADFSFKRAHIARILVSARRGDGNDAIDGNGGNDLARLGAGDDAFTWDPGDGSDTIDGRSGNDVMRFNGAAAAEQINLSANGSHLKFTRDVASITMDTVGVERVDFNALGGADAVTVNDLTGTDVNSVNVDLAGALGGAAGDGAADRVIVNGTAGNDAIDVSGDANVVKVSGLAATTKILHPEAANDRLEVNTLAGADTVATVGLVPGSIQLFVNGVLVP